ncbi:MAG: hypothetical protein KatS3mg094_302 [Candidatus Parcubacteria bacterium]|nr:MAG: hypothetical protein KatS3mg094_302 [Candidatus Parcubacteria bacterium]
MNNLAVNYPNTPVDLIQFYFLDIIGRLINFIPNLILALLFILLGYLIGWVFETFIKYIVAKLSINKYLIDLGFGKFLEKSNVELRAEIFLGKLVFWLIFLVFLVSAFDILGLSSFSQLLNEIIRFLPRALVAGLIFVLAIFLGDLIKRLVYVFLRGIETKGAELGSDIIYYVIVIFGLILSLNQLGIATDVFNILLFGMALAFALAIGLSFGLGGQDVARDFLHRLRDKF